MGVHENKDPGFPWQRYHPLEEVPGKRNGIGMMQEAGGIPLICAGCHSRIFDRFYLVAVDRPWHSSCLRCYQCKTLLETKITCFEKDGSIFCKEDYYRLFSSKRCARCDTGIAANELVMRVRQLLFHVHCFSCCACSKLLTKGEQFGMRGMQLFCSLHFECITENTFRTDDEGDDGVSCRANGSSGSMGFQNTPIRMPEYCGGSPSGPKYRQRRRKNFETSNDVPIHPIELSSPGSGGNGVPTMEGFSFDMSLSPGNISGQHPVQRTKRMRTSFKHHQLRTMKAYFAINQNPDAKDLKQLSQKTQLSKRVLQVWFQNARAKWRRTIMRQEALRQSRSSSEKSSPSPGSEIPGEAVKGGITKNAQFLDITNCLTQKGKVEESSVKEFSELFG